MRNLRVKWVGRWDARERQFRFFRVMWEHGRLSYKLGASVRRWLPRVSLRSSGGLWV